MMIYLPFSLEKRIDYLAASDERFIVHSDFIFIDGAGSEFTTSVKNRKGRNPLSGKCFKQLFLKGTNMLPSSVMIKREVFDTIGLFDESFCSAEDYDLWLRISCCYPLSFIDEPLVKYRIHEDNLTHNTMRGEIHSARALLKAAENVPDIEMLIGKSALHRRLSQVCFDTAYLSLTNGDLVTGRHYLKKAWHWGRKPKTLLILVATKYFGALVGKYYSRKVSE